MFTKPKEAAPEIPATTTTATAAPVPQPPKQQRPAGTRSAPSIISSDLVVTGTLSSSGDMQVDGRVEGDVHSAGLVIGEKAVIQGEVLADEVTVRGRVEGSIRARKILLCSTCHVEGNILHEAFAVEAGAFFEGNCRHSDSPLSEENARRNPAHDRKSVHPTVSTAGVVATNGGSATAAKPVDARPATVSTAA
ncbi:MAG TPA: polymer-forming cytoskeletal protein [Rhizomicrobium sp.]|jgi:cytoskeletal protein CcmA (bactofilin family)|nr:polymer-forming cytoskeletal protein [Rhizomicrobium sp.]